MTRNKLLLHLYKVVSLVEAFIVITVYASCVV